MSKKVAEPLPEYLEMAPLWSLTAALRGGTPAMRAAGEDYLPREPRESPEAYKIRLLRSVLTNHYAKAVGKLSGKPHRKPISIKDTVPPTILEYTKNITNTGINIDVLSRRWLEAAIDDGVAHILVDMPKIEAPGTLPGGALSIADQRSRNIRPYATIIRSRDLIGWKSEIQSGERVLTQIRIKEETRVADPENEFSDKAVHRVRVIEPRFMRLYEMQIDKEGEEDWVLIDEVETGLNKVPLISLYTRRTGFMTAMPWLIDLAYLNLAHFQSDSDQRNILHVARVPILFGTGFGDEDDGDRVSITVGVSQFARGPKGATLQFVEHGGQGIESGRKDLEDLELRMQLMAMEPIIRGRASGATTATQRAMDQAEEDTELGALARALENALESVLSLMNEWLGGNETFEDVVELFKDFGISAADAEVLRTLVATRNSGDMSRSAYIHELKRRGVLSDEFDPETDADLLELEGPGDEDLFSRPSGVEGNQTFANSGQ